MTGHRVAGPCFTSWSHLRGWRAWRDRLVYRHTVHSCDRAVAGHLGGHVCMCGARCDWMTTKDEVVLVAKHRRSANQ